MPQLTLEGVLPIVQDLAERKANAFIYFSRRITLSQGRSLSQAHEEANDSLLPF